MQITVLPGRHFQTFIAVAEAIDCDGVSMHGMRYAFKAADVRKTLVQTSKYDHMRWMVHAVCT
jgi:hypothetical protein